MDLLSLLSGHLGQGKIIRLQKFIEGFLGLLLELLIYEILKCLARNSFHFIFILLALGLAHRRRIIFHLGVDADRL